MKRRESLEAAKLDALLARLDQAEHDSAAGRVAAYEPGLLDRLDDAVEDRSGETAAP